MSRIVREIEPGAFRLWDASMPVIKTSARETVIVQREGVGEISREDRDCEPYQVELKLASVAGWSDDELAACGLFQATPFTASEGEQITGDVRYERVKGAVVEVYDVEDVPPPPAEPTKEERVSRLLADYGLTKDDLAAVVQAEAKAG